jgi:hypothetical protein
VFGFLAGNLPSEELPAREEKPPATGENDEPNNAAAEVANGMATTLNNGAVPLSTGSNRQTAWGGRRCAAVHCLWLLICLSRRCSVMFQVCFF